MSAGREKVSARRAPVCVCVGKRKNALTEQRRKYISQMSPRPASFYAGREKREVTTREEKEGGEGRKRTTANLPTSSPLPFHQLRSIVFSLQMNRCRVAMETGQSRPVRLLCFIISRKAEWWRGNTHRHPQSMRVAPPRHAWKHTIRAHRYWMVTARQHPFDDVSHSDWKPPTFKEAIRRRAILAATLIWTRHGGTPSQGDKRPDAFRPLPGEKWPFERDKRNPQAVLEV